MILHVAVLAEDIEQGCRSDVFLCPVALALRRAIIAVTGSRWAFVKVGPNCIWREPPGRGIAVRDALPLHVVEWIAAFDRKKTVSPFEFDIELQSL